MRVKKEELFLMTAPFFFCCCSVSFHSWCSPVVKVCVCVCGQGGLEQVGGQASLCVTLHDFSNITNQRHRDQLLYYPLA